MKPILDSHPHIYKRWITFMAFTLVMIFITSCQSQEISADCESQTDPTDRDVRYALKFSGKTFESDDWQRSYTVESGRVSITWLNHSTSSLAFMDYLLYSCGYTQEEIDDYHSDQNFEEVIFRDYQDVQRTSTCSVEAGDLRLHEFTASVEERDYIIRYWVKLDSPTRVLDTMLVFPAGSEAELERYASEILPELSVCP